VSSHGDEGFQDGAITPNIDRNDLLESISSHSQPALSDKVVTKPERQEA